MFLRRRVCSYNALQVLLVEQFIVWQRTLSGLCRTSDKLSGLLGLNSQNSVLFKVSSALWASHICISDFTDVEQIAEIQLVSWFLPSDPAIETLVWLGVHPRSYFEPQRFLTQRKDGYLERKEHRNVLKTKVFPPVWRRWVTSALWKLLLSCFAEAFLQVRQNNLWSQGETVR